MPDTIVRFRDRFQALWFVMFGSVGITSLCLAARTAHDGQWGAAALLVVFGVMGVFATFHAIDGITH